MKKLPVGGKRKSHAMKRHKDWLPGDSTTKGRRKKKSFGKG